MSALTALSDDILAERAPHRFTVSDLYALVRTGVLEEGGPQELIEGEVVDMPADGPRHKEMSNLIGFWLYGALAGGDYFIAANATLVLSDVNAPSPDWQILPRSVPVDDMKGADALLVIEQADSSARRDLGWKADLYARHGVRDYWVIDIGKRELHVHRDPTETGYGFRQRHGADSAVAALLIPGLTLRLDRLGGPNRSSGG